MYLTIVDAFDPVFCLVSSFRLQDHDVRGEDEPEGGGVFRFFVLDVLYTGERVATLDLHLRRAKRENLLLQEPLWIGDEAITVYMYMQHVL